jgi:hypothetical protein
MGVRSKIALLPAPVREKLDNLIVDRAFGGYQDLAEWLQQQGYSVARNSVQRHGARLQQQIQARMFSAEQAKTMAALGHSAREIADSLTAIQVHLIQQQVLSSLLQGTATAQTSDQPATRPSPSQAEELKGEPGENSVSRENSEDAAPADDIFLPEAIPPIIPVSDLVRLARITTDLNRVINPRPRAAEAKAAMQKSASSDAPPERKGKGLSEEAYHSIRNALLEPFPVEAYRLTREERAKYLADRDRAAASSANPQSSEDDPPAHPLDPAQPGQTHLSPPGRTSRR